MTDDYQKDKVIRQLDFLINTLGFSEKDMESICSHPDWNPGRIIAEYHRLDQIEGFGGETYAREHFFEANPELLEEYQPPQTSAVLPVGKFEGLELNKTGSPLQTIDNFLKIMLRDPKYSVIHFNLMTMRPEIHNAVTGTVTEWTDVESAQSEHYIQSEYKLYKSEMHIKALRILFHRREYNPLLELVESFEWDGFSRIENCLSDVLKVEVSTYTREVSRLIFAGGINRLYEPGCKYDCVPILIGKQGCGKSTFVEMLALNSDYCGFTKNLSGDQKSIESLSGLWFVEIAELAAFRAADIESLKAFTTARVDRYRLPFDRNVSSIPRRCCFIGTTNSHSFLTDATGNRRFFPVEVNSNGYDIARDRDALQEYIAQCWAEARERYKAGKMSPVPDASLIDDFQKAQAQAAVEDWRVGLIEEYISRLPPNHAICTKEIYNQALYHDSTREQTRRDSNEIGEILDSLPYLERMDDRTYTENYGRQRCWKVKIS